MNVRRRRSADRRSPSRISRPDRPHRSGRIRAVAAAAGTAALLTPLAACSGGAPGAADGKVDVVASFYPMEFLAERIGGEHVSVTALTKPGVEPHDLEITPQQTGELGEADVAFYLKGLQPAVDEAVAQSGVGTAVDAATLTDADSHGAGGGHEHGDEHGHEHGEEHGHEGEEQGHADEHAGEQHSESPDEHAADEHEHAAGDGHDHGGSDPHLWLNPVAYAEMAEGFGKALEKADPDHAADYKKNTETLVGQLKKLDQDFEKGLRDRSTDTFITTHAAFGHLADRYGLRQEAVNGVSPEADPSPARIKELHEIAEQEKVSTVFFETLVSDATAKTLAADTGLKTDVLDPLEGITEKSAGKNYLDVMRANLSALREALGAA